jgi:hypothetical protein
MPMFRFWWSRLSAVAKVRSFVGTARRVFRKRLRQPEQIIPFEPARTTASNRNPKLELVELSAR